MCIVVLIVNYPDTVKKSEHTTTIFWQLLHYGCEIKFVHTHVITWKSKGHNLVLIVIDLQNVTLREVQSDHAAENLDSLVDRRVWANAPRFLRGLILTFSKIRVFFNVTSTAAELLRRS